MVNEILAPASIPEAAALVKDHDRLWICGLDRHRDWRCDAADGFGISSRSLVKPIRIEPADQVAEFEAGIPLSQVQANLLEKRQCLPWRSYFTGDDPTLAGALSLALPHWGESEYGSWRDWVLGFSMVRADGAITKGGSSAMKNVAGYDLHRFLPGTRGSLGFIVTVIMRTAPLKCLPPEGATIPAAGPHFIQRVRRSDWETAAAGGPLIADESSCTLVWGTQPKRFDRDWIIRSGQSQGNLDPMQADTALFWDRLQSRIDPDHKWGDGHFGGAASGTTVAGGRQS